MTIALCIYRWSLAIVLALAVANVGSAQILGANNGSAKSDAVKLDPEVKQTAWPSIPLPKITMPKISMPDMSVITSPVKAGYGKVTDGTKKAWEGTKEMFTFGKGDAATAASSQPKEGFWKRMFSQEEDKKDGPQTVGEWMAQPRLDP